MSGRTWVPGDVALIRVGTGDWEYGIRGFESWVCQHMRNPDAGQEGVQARPLLVIDPEDREQVERLTAAIADTSATRIPWAERVSSNRERSATGVQEALRSLLATKPEDPRALGAVVRSGDGTLWTRIAVAEAGPVWRRAGSGFSAATWADLNVSTPDQILSAGWVEDGAP